MLRIKNKGVHDDVNSGGMKEVSRSVVIDDNVNLTALSYVDMIRLIISTFNKDEAAELDAAGKVSVERSTKLGSLDDFFRRATTKMERQGMNSVTMNISSSYLKYIDEVIDPKTGWGRYYDIKYIRTNIPDNVKHKFLCHIRKREV